MSEYDAPPFGAPMSNFMQTGNNTVINEPTPVDDFSVGQPIVDETQQPEMAATGFPPPFLGTPPSQQNQSTEKQKYQIIDLFWMINPGLYTNPPKIVNGQAQFVVLSFNISFGNLRVSFFNIPQGAIQNNVAFLNNMQRTVTGTIYPASAFCIANSARLSTVCLEQLFKSTGEDWQQSRPKCTVEKNEEIIRLTIDDSKNGKYFYDFVGWQKSAFTSACQFVYTTGFYLQGMNMLK